MQLLSLVLNYILYWFCSTLENSFEVFVMNFAGIAIICIGTLSKVMLSIVRPFVLALCFYEPKNNGKTIELWARAGLRLQSEWKRKSVIVHDIRMLQNTRKFSMIALGRSEKSKIAQSNPTNTRPKIWDNHNFANNHMITQ
jgi:hypothetical protein